jgi:hypothetical protein
MTEIYSCNAKMIEHTKLVNTLYHINRIKEKETVIPTDTEKAVDKNSTQLYD